MTTEGSEDLQGVRGSGKDQTKSWLANRPDATELFSLLESRDSKILDEVKALVHENLHTTRESWFLCALVEYYLSTKSSRCLDILTGIREPNDKYLFDKILECLKSHQWREEALFLLSHVVRKQPSWLHRIAHHKVLTTLLQLLKTDTNIPHLMSGLLTVVTLLPIIPSLAGPHLNDIFEVFARLAAWNTRKTGNVPEVYFLHLRVALNHLFCRLYAMYPCNFLAFLRSHYGGRENSRESRDNMHVFSETIKPMLERVRLHPLLVTASKEMELGIVRWKNLEPHDIIVQCSKVSLDTVEGFQHEGEENAAKVGHTEPTNIVRQWSLSDSMNVHLPIEPGSLVGDTLDQLMVAPTACPLQICDFSPTNEIQEPQEEPDGLNSLVTSVASNASKAEYDLDYELTDTKNQQDEVDGGSLSTFKESGDLCKTDSSSGISRSSEGDVVTAEEAKEESQKLEVSAQSAVCNRQAPLQGQQMDSTSQHFVSTTDTLTATMTFSNVDDPAEGPAIGSLSVSSAQDEDFAAPLAALGDASNVLLERLVHGINRLRFFSHCGHPPEIPLDWLRRSPTLRKSHSWPLLKSDSVNVSPHETINLVNSPDSTSASIITSASVQETISNKQFPDACRTPVPKQQEIVQIPAPPLPSVTSPAVPPKGAHLPVPDLPNTVRPHSMGPSLVPSSVPFTYPSPSELLDTYLHLGSQVYLHGLSLTSGKDTNWTHFGGPAPADELTILRGEITLLHTQLLFERYRREVHAERNRRLLGKAKKARALEEQNSAMKDQLVLQEKEIQDLNHKLFLCQVKSQGESAASTKDLHDHLRLLQQDNQKLDAGRQKLEYSLGELQKEKADLIKTLDERQCQLLESTQELESARREASLCGYLQREVKLLTCQLANAYDLHQRYLDKIEHEPKPTDLAFHLSQLEGSATHEIEDLKHQCKSQSVEIEANKIRVGALEQALANKDLVIEEQKQLLENVKSSHKDIVKAKMNRIHSLQKISQQQEEHILELRSKLCLQDSSPSRPGLSQIEKVGNSEEPWQPAQLEPSAGIQILPNESDNHTAHSTNQDISSSIASYNLP